MRDIPLVARGALERAGKTQEAAKVRETFAMRDRKDLATSLTGDIAGARVVPGDINESIQRARLGFKRLEREYGEEEGRIRREARAGLKSIESAVMEIRAVRNGLKREKAAAVERIKALRGF